MSTAINIKTAEWNVLWYGYIVSVTEIKLFNNANGTTPMDFKAKLTICSNDPKS